MSPSNIIIVLTKEQYKNPLEHIPRCIQSVVDVKLSHTLHKYKIIISFKVFPLFYYTPVLKIILIKLLTLEMIDRFKLSF